MQASFTYREQLLAHQIRVLHVHPALHLDADISCDVQVVERSRESEYAALSYSWGMNADGDASPCRSISICGQCMPVTRNLYEGLKHLRNPQTALRIWIDAVCINQQDIPERNAQVAAMADVYACATRVIVWLGEGSSAEDDAAAFTLLGYLASRNDDDDDDDGDAQLYGTKFVVSDVEVDIADVHRWAREDVSKKVKAWRLSEDLHLRKSIFAITRVTDALLGRRWFSRRWIVQEVVIPHNDNIRIHWGRYSMPFGRIIGNQLHGLFKYEFRKTFDLLPTQDMSEEELQEHHHIDSLLARVRRLSQRCTNLARMQSESASHANRLTDALWIYSRQGCSDPRDRLYALLSLAPSTSIVPDYSLSTAELYIQFAIYLVVNGYIGMLFSSARELTAHDPFLGEAVMELAPLDLPSWVPDLRLPFSGGSISSPSITASVDRNNILECEMNYIGRIQSASASLEVVTDSMTDETFSLPANLSKLILPGDIACLAPVSDVGTIVVLRNADDLQEQYRLVRTVDPREVAAFQYGARVPRASSPSSYYII